MSFTCVYTLWLPSECWADKADREIKAVNPAINIQYGEGYDSENERPEFWLTVKVGFAQNELRADVPLLWEAVFGLIATRNKGSCSGFTVTNDFTGEQADIVELQNMFYR